MLAAIRTVSSVGLWTEPLQNPQYSGVRFERQEVWKQTGFKPGVPHFSVASGKLFNLSLCLRVPFWKRGKIIVPNLLKSL